VINSYAGSDDAAVATAGARAGTDVVRNLYGRRLDRIDKGAGDFATAADVQAEAAILNVIRAARPDDAVLGEEGGQRGAADAVRQWRVDPLCGTLNYAASAATTSPRQLGHPPHGPVILHGADYAA
jgi:myo-inositol-1(or 4)-monophosphatase